MGLPWSLIKILLFYHWYASAAAETYNARVGTDNYVNVVSRNFLSFTVDPKYLFSSGEKYGNSQECICMAASLTPAYLRIAGPSTALMAFRNSTITIDPQEIIPQNYRDSPKNYPGDSKNYFFKNFLGKRKRYASQPETDLSLEEDVKKSSLRRIRRQARSRDTKPLGKESKNILEHLLRRHKKIDGEVQMNSDMWKKFSAWAKATGFDIVFALNNEEKSRSGLWDPNTTMDILSVAEKEGLGNIFWQLGYECSNQSIDEYLNDLETLRVIVETFPGGGRGWKVVGADVTSCLREDSKSDFKDYVALSLDMTDALMLNGNSSSYELERLSPAERSKLLRLVHASSSPLWVSERPPQTELSELSELERAAAWMASLGHAARRGAQAHFRELTERELYQPTLSFYMALLFKNLVGERVLNVEMESSHTVLFAHCTSLRRQVVPGAVTLYGANMDDEPARLSVKLSKREEGGDIMQFILSQDERGNIIVNGREMSQEGDIRPVVRRVRPYKTLLINLPARSFGFWVVANTKVEPCRYYEENDKENLGEAEPVDKNKKQNKARSKRSLAKEDNANEEIQLHNKSDEYDVVKTGNKEFDDKIQQLNNYLREIHNSLTKKPSTKVKRQAFDGQGTKKLRQLLKIRNDLKNIDEDKPILSFIGNLLQFARNGAKNLGVDRIKNLRVQKNKIGKRHHNAKDLYNTNSMAKRTNINKLETAQGINDKKVSRTKRNIVNESNGKNEDIKNYETINATDADILNAANYEKEVLENKDGGKYLDYADDFYKNNLISDYEQVDISKDNSNNDKNVTEFFTDIDNSKNIEILKTSNDSLYKEDLISDNEIEISMNNNKKLWEVLHNIQSQLKRISKERNEHSEEPQLKHKELDKLVVKTEINNEGATIDFKEQPNRGWIKSTFESFFYALNDLNQNMNRLWDALSLFE